MTGPRYAPGLKTIDDATYLRRRILLAFERAENEDDPDERRRADDLRRDRRRPDRRRDGRRHRRTRPSVRSPPISIRSIRVCARIILVEAAPRVLTPFDPALSETARRSLEQLGVEVRLGVPVTDCNGDGVASATSSSPREPSSGPPA